MPRSRSGGARAPASRAPSRPAPAPSRPVAPPPQSRSASTAARPPQSQTASATPPAQTSSPGGGLFANMASTAAGVAVGSSLGHAITGMFGGGSSQIEQQADPLLQSQANDQQLASSCDFDARALTKCLNENKGEHQMTICGWYLEQLKACQQAARPY